MGCQPSVEVKNPERELSAVPLATAKMKNLAARMVTWEVPAENWCPRYRTIDRPEEKLGNWSYDVSGEYSYESRHVLDPQFILYRNVEITKRATYGSRFISETVKFGSLIVDATSLEYLLCSEDGVPFYLISHPEGYSSHLDNFTIEKFEAESATWHRLPSKYADAIRLGGAPFLGAVGTPESRVPLRMVISDASIDDASSSDSQSSELSSLLHQ
jgi:hypothetical protein